MRRHLIVTGICLTSLIPLGGCSWNGDGQAGDEASRPNGAQTSLAIDLNFPELAGYPQPPANDPIWRMIKKSAKSYYPLLPGTTRRYQTAEGTHDVTIGIPIQVEVQRDGAMRSVIPVHGVSTGLILVQDDFVYLVGEVKEGQVELWGGSTTEIPLFPQEGEAWEDIETREDCVVKGFVTRKTQIGSLSRVAEVQCEDELGNVRREYYAPEIGLIGDDRDIEILAFQRGSS